MSALPPILPETLIDVVHAVGGLDSAVEGQRILGAAARVQFFEELPKAHAEDPVASRYLTEVLAATASALRAFSAVRTPYKAMREREQSIDALRRGLLSPSYLLTPADKSSTRSWPMWLLRSTPLVLAAGSPIWAEFLGLSGPGLVAVVGVAVVFALCALAWFAFADVLIARWIARLQERSYRGLGNYNHEVGQAWKAAFPGYKSAAVDLIVAAERARARHYPDGQPLLPGVRFDVAAHEVEAFLRTPHAALGGARPIDAISAIVDEHFSVDPGEATRYVGKRNRARGAPAGLAQASLAELPAAASIGSGDPAANSPAPLDPAPDPQEVP